MAWSCKCLWASLASLALSNARRPRRVYSAVSVSFSSSSLRSLSLALRNALNSLWASSHGAGELLEVQAQGQFQLGLVFGFLAGQQLVAVQVNQALAAVLPICHWPCRGRGWLPSAHGSDGH